MGEASSKRFAFDLLHEFPVPVLLKRSNLMAHMLDTIGSGVQIDSIRGDNRQAQYPLNIF